MQGFYSLIVTNIPFRIRLNTFYLFFSVTMSDKPTELYTYDYNDDDHPHEVLDALSQFYLGGLFTDVSLQGSSGRVFHCHRAVLSARSSYFRAMFTADMRERSNSLITLSGVECEVLCVLLHYTYTAHLAFNIHSKSGANKCSG